MTRCPVVFVRMKSESVSRPQIGFSLCMTGFLSITIPTNAQKHPRIARNPPHCSLNAGINFPYIIYEIMRFFLQINGQSEGPFTVEEIEDLHGAGRVNRSTPCRPETKGAWSSIYNLVPTAIWVTSPRNKPVPVKGDPPDRSWIKENILWIGLSCLVALAFLIPLFVIVSDQFASKERTTRLQAPAPPPVSYNAPAGMQRSMHADVDQMNKQMEEANHAAAAFLGFALLFPIAMGGVGLILFAFWLWMLITVVTTEPEGSDKIVWTLVVVITGPLGAAIYFFARYIKKEKVVYAR
jgi:hypothetical protein